MQRYKSVVTLGLLLIAVFLFFAPAFAEHPWVEGRGKGNNAEDLLDEHPWVDHPGKGRGGAAEGLDWMTYLRSCLRWLYR